jgi:hypothetical protein
MTGLSFFKTLLVGAVVCLLLLGCSDGKHSGNSAETGNPEIAGRVFVQGGVPAVSARVQCIPVAYNPRLDTHSTMQTVYADSTGYFALDSLQSGMCNLEILHESSGMGTVVSGLQSDHSEPVFVHTSLQPLGSLRISLGTANNGDSGFVYVRGSSFYQKVVVQYSSLFLDSLFAGFLDSIFYQPYSQKQPVFLANSVQIVANTMQISGGEPLAEQWQVVVNTGVTGANLQDTLFGFPWLWRGDTVMTNMEYLDTAVGQFYAYRVGASQDTVPLGIQINHWNKQQQSAAFWVHLDTLVPQARDTIYVVYSESKLPSLHNPKEPFDRDGSIAAVWHFEDNSLVKNNEVFVQDNGPFGWHGQGFNVKKEDGVVGSAFWYDGRTSYITIPQSERGQLNLEFGEPATISVWARLDAPNTSRFVVSKGAKQFHLKYQHPDGWLFESTDNLDPARYHISRHYLAQEDFTDTWYHLAVVTGDGNVQKLYVNGVLRDTVSSSSVADTLRVTSIPFQIGMVTELDGAAHRHFWGVIDELSVWNTNQSADWVKMMWYNQKLGE